MAKARKKTVKKQKAKKAAKSPSAKASAAKKRAKVGKPVIDRVNQGRSHHLAERRHAHREVPRQPGLRDAPSWQDLGKFSLEINDAAA